MTIQEAAQKILLIFYMRHTTQGFIADDEVQFEYDSGCELDCEDEYLKAVLKEEVNGSIHIKNAPQYLEDKGLNEMTTYNRGVQMP